MAQIRQAREQQMQQQQMAEAASAVPAGASDLAAAGKNLSETDVGGGINALEMMLSGETGMAA